MLFELKSTDIGYYYVKLSTGAYQHFIKASQPVLVTSASDKITLKGEVVSGKSTISWETNKNGKLDIKIGRLYEEPSQSWYLNISSQPGNGNHYNHRYDGNATSQVAYLFADGKLIAASNLMTLSQPRVTCPAKGETKSKIKNVVILIPENHSFLSYFGSYCKAEPHSNPSCNYGPECCERNPEYLMLKNGKKQPPIELDVD